MRKVLKELNDLTAESGQPNTEQSCLKPKKVKESVNKSKNAKKGRKKDREKGRKRTPDELPADTSNQSDEPIANQPMNEEIGEPEVVERPTVQTTGQSTEQSGTEQPAVTEQSVSSEPMTNLTETLSSMVQNEFKCSICQELVVNASGLSCSHVFCKCCIDEWLDKNRRCPVCRKTIKRSTGRHHVLPIDNFLQLYFSKFGTTEQQAERTRLVSERQAREVILIEDSPSAPAQPRSNDLFYSFGFAVDGQLPHTRNRRRGRMARAPNLERRFFLNREWANEVSIRPENATDENQQASSSTNSASQPTGHPIEVITGPRSERRTGEQQATTRRPTPIVSPRRFRTNQLTSPQSSGLLSRLSSRPSTRRSSRPSQRSRTTQTLSPPTIEIVPIIEVDEMNFDDLSSLGFEIDLIDLAENDRSNDSGGTLVVDRPRDRRHREMVSPESVLRPRRRGRERRREHRREHRRDQRREQRRRERRREQRRRERREARTLESISPNRTPGRTSRLVSRTGPTRISSTVTNLRRTSPVISNQTVTDSSTGQTVSDSISRTTIDMTPDGLMNRPTARRSMRTFHRSSGETTSTNRPRSTGEDVIPRNSSGRLRTGSSRLSRNQLEDLRSRREERRRTRRNRRLDINDYLLNRKHQH